MALPVLEFNVGDSKVLRFRWLQADGVAPVDLTGLTIKFFAREKAGDTGYTINPVEANVPDPTDGRFTFDVTMPTDPTNSVYWITREDGLGKVDTAQPAKGTEIAILAK
jgi:hypothetical protein